MKWTKLKQLVEQRIAPSIRSRFAINSAAYGACSCGHAWITLDKKVVANFCTRAFWNIPRKFDDSARKWVSKDPELSNSISSPDDKDLTNYGELSRQDAYQACWEFVHNLSIDDALSSEDPLVQSLAVIDTRVGKRKLKNIDVDKLHPLAAKLFTERCLAEGLVIKDKIEQETNKLNIEPFNE